MFVNAYLQSALYQLCRDRFLRSMQDIVATQWQTLHAIVSANADTWFGKKYHFTAIRSLQDYQKSVPIFCYQDMESLIERCMAGKQRILTQARVHYFQMTSGSTTGQPKFIPSTSIYQRKVVEALFVSRGFLHASQRKMQPGKGLWLLCPLPMGRTDKGIPCGLASSYFTHMLRPAWRWLSIVPSMATRVEDSDTRRYLYWRYALHIANLTNIGSPYIVSLITFASTLFQRSEDLIRDVADGTLNAALALSPLQRAALLAQLEPDRQRAKSLENIAGQYGGLLPRAVWPDLGWLCTVYGPAYSHYEQQLAWWYGPEFIWGMPYLASEGLIGIPWQANAYTHLPAITTTFLEFIPEEDWSSHNPQTCLLTDLIPGQRYTVVLTGWNGLYRYCLDDIIEIDGYCNNMPTLKVVSRRTSVLSIVFEKLTEAEIVTAVKFCTADCHIAFVDFVVDIDQTTLPPRYQLWAEPTNSALSLDVSHIQAAFDHYLCQFNINYRWLRGSGDIAPPVVRLLPSGTFEEQHRVRERAGMPMEQIKVIHAVPHWYQAGKTDQC